MRLSEVFIAVAALWVCTLPAEQKPLDSSQRPYSRFEIVRARYGTRKVIEKARANLDKFVQGARNVLVGQDGPIEDLSAKVIQYLAGYGTRERDPVAANLLGLYAHGKSELTHGLKLLGIRTIHIDVQQYLHPETSLGRDLHNTFHPHLNPQGPLILILDEIDKVLGQVPGSPEFRAGQAFLAELNELLTDGKITFGSRKLDMSNAFVLSCMNLSPNLVEEWLGKQPRRKGPKTFYEMKAADFEKFHQWISTEHGKHLTLSRSLPPQTVGRVGTNTILFNPLRQNDYPEIVRRNLRASIARATEGRNAGRRLTVLYSPRFEQFLNAEGVFEPSGARHTVFAVGNIVDQAIAYGMFAKTEEDTSSSRPKEVFLDYDSKSKKVIIRVTSLLGAGKHTHRGNPVILEPVYRRETNTLRPPEGLLLEQTEAIPEATPRITNADVRQKRKPERRFAPFALVEPASLLVVGQDEPMLEVLEDDINSYLSSKPDGLGRGHKRLVLGFSGNGKTTGIEAILAAAEIPVIKLNLQAYQNDPGGFVTVLEKMVATVSWPYAVLIEEGDKVPEMQLDPGTGTYIPVIPSPAVAGILKQLFDSKRVVLTAGEFGPQIKEANIQDAYLIATMNFGSNNFRFEPDPRLTTFEDVASAWHKLQNPVKLKGLLGQIFLPDFVNRVSAHIVLSNPLDAEDHARIIQLAVERTAERLLGGPGKAASDNTARVQIKLTPAYRRYLFGESVVPSEGGRKTAEESAKILERDLGEALLGLRASGPESTHPVRITLDYRRSPMESVASNSETQSCATGTCPVSGAQFAEESQTGTVSAKAKLLNRKERSRTLFWREVALNFPPLEIEGPIVPDRRLTTALHEFGHAITLVLYGLPFESIVVEQIKPGVAGFVVPRPVNGNGETQFIEVLYALGSRALQRAIWTKPEERDSVRKTGQTASGDLEDVTSSLYGYIYELGQAPQAGVGARTGKKGCQMAKGASDVQYGNLSPEEGRALQLILRKLEDHLTEVLRASFSREWYREKIEALARKGIMSEAEFYALIGHDHSEEFFPHRVDSPLLAEFFGNVVLPQPVATGWQGDLQVKDPSTLLKEALEVLDEAMETYYVPLANKPYEETVPSPCSTQLRENGQSPHHSLTNGDGSVDK